MSEESSRKIKMSFIPWTRTHGYDFIRTSEENEESVHLKVENRSTKPWSTRKVLVLLFLVVAVSSTGAFLLGASWKSPVSRDLLIPDGGLTYPMVYNKTFTLAPSIESNAAWDSMFPKGVGFVKHPKIAPKASGLAVFHELHCVNILRVGYYAALDGSLEQMQHIHDHNKRPDPHHLRHCFDYLRQSLICAADTNLEPVDLALGGVTGWRFERKCRDFPSVKEWAERNRHWPDLAGNE